MYLLRNDHVLRTLTLRGALLLSMGLTLWVLTPFLQWLFPPTSIGVIFLYLPHGVRILGAWLFGWKSIAYLLPGNIVHFAIFNTSGIDPITLVLMSLAVMLSPPFSFKILAFFGFDLRRNHTLRFNWRSVVFAGGLASLINALTLHIILFNDIPAEEHLSGVTLWVIGDVTGVVAVMAAMLVARRWVVMKA